jgi:hypothetical protein
MIQLRIIGQEERFDPGHPDLNDSDQGDDCPEEGQQHLTVTRHPPASHD